MEGVFTLPVIQQPAGQADYVSRDPESITQFEMASEFGNIGLLAHNDLSGSFFSQLRLDQDIQLVYSDGRIESFVINRIQRYQAISPYSTSGDFRDLQSLKVLTAAELFRDVYMGPRHLTLQTCISENGNLSWGRLFIIAVPAAGFHPSPDHHSLSRE